MPQFSAFCFRSFPESSLIDIPSHVTVLHRETFPQIVEGPGQMVVMSPHYGPVYGVGLFRFQTAGTSLSSDPFSIPERGDPWDLSLSPPELPQSDSY